MNNTIPIQIRFVDIDMNQHVNNATYFTYMENARAELMMDAFLSCFEQGILFVVAEANCKYKRPIKFTDQVNCEIRLELTGSFHFTITYLFKDANTAMLYAEGITKMVMVDKESNRPMAIPEAFIKKYLG